MGPAAPWVLVALRALFREESGPDRKFALRRCHNLAIPEAMDPPSASDPGPNDLIEPEHTRRDLRC